MARDDETPRDDSARFHRRDSADGGLVERLLSAAGPGPEIPEGGADRVKAAIRTSWKIEVAVAARQRRRLWAGGLAASAVLVLAVAVVPRLKRDNLPVGPVAITLEVAHGALEITPPGSTVQFLGPDDAGAIILDGSLLRTRQDRRAALRLTGGQSLRLDEETVVRLDSERSISLDSGAVYISSAAGSLSGVEVRTALGTAIDIGTQFEVRLGNDTLDIRVREGLVSLARGAEEYQINHGIRLSVDAAGGVTTGSISSWDATWAWTQDVAPVFEIEGRSVLAFLNWVSAETGLSVRFADAAVEQAAATTLLHGTIEGLAPAETPAAVLPTCGLAAVAETGALVVRPRDTGEE